MDASLREQRGYVLIDIHRVNPISVVANHPARHVALDAIHEVICPWMLVYRQHAARTHPYHRDADAGAFERGKFRHVDSHNTAIGVIEIGVLVRVVPPVGILFEELIPVVPCSGGLQGGD
jgi:hypothetical protein